MEDISRSDSLAKRLHIDGIGNRRLYRQIADQITRLIDSREFAVGSKLPAERELSEALGVSRPSLREALIALEVEGLVEVRGGSGVFVLERRAPARREMGGAVPSPGPFDIIRARWIIESECAYLAATNATPEQLQRMKSALGLMQEHGSKRFEATAADERFHLTLAEASGNSALFLVVQQLWELRTGVLYLQFESHFTGEAILNEAVEEHRQLLNALAARDPDAARQAMRTHVKNAEVRFASAWKSGE
jgi:DNA-binding FadR family transcriptional regulator